MTDKSVPQDASMDWLDQLAYLREMSKTTKTIHEAQAMQLRIWPRVALPHTKSSTANVDFDTKTVSFSCQRDQSEEEPEDLQERLEQLTQWTQFLLGDDWLVTIFLSNNLIHTGFPKTKSKEEDNDEDDRDGGHDPGGPNGEGEDNSTGIP